MPFGPGQAGGGEAAHRQADLAGGLGDREDRLAAVAGVADDAAADPLAAELELRLDHRQHLAAGRQAARDRGQDLGQGDEGDVDGRQRGREGQVGGQQLAGVEALDHGHPRVFAQAHVDLAVGDVDRGDPRRAALQQAVGEAAGRGADVEAVAPGDVDPERLQRVLQLGAAARDVARAGVDDQRRLRLDQLARPQGDRPVLADPDFAGPHRAGRGRARREQPLLRQNRVYPGLLHRATLQRPYSRLLEAQTVCNIFLPALSHWCYWRTLHSVRPNDARSERLCDPPHTQIARMFVRCSRIRVEKPMKEQHKDFLAESRVVHIAPVASHNGRPRHNRAHLPPTDPHI